MKHLNHKLCEMSDIILISPSDGDDASIVEVLPWYLFCWSLHGEVPKDDGDDMC